MAHANAFTVRASVSLLAIAAVVGCRPPDEMNVGETGVNIVNDEPGRGRAAEEGDIVCIDYSVRIHESTEEVRWGKDFCFTLGRGAVVAGMDEAIPGMHTGGRRLIKVPPHKHWGREGYADGLIPARATLEFEIRLKSIE